MGNQEGSLVKSNLVVLLFADVDCVNRDFEEMDSLRASPAAVGRHQRLCVGVDDPSRQGIGAEIWFQIFLTFEWVTKKFEFHFLTYEWINTSRNRHWNSINFIFNLWMITQTKR